MDEPDAAAVEALSTPRLNHLLPIVKSLSITSPSQPLLSAYRLKSLLLQSGIPRVKQAAAGSIEPTKPTPVAPKSAYEEDLEWLLVTKATIQVYGIILNVLLDRIISLSDDIWYWSEVLNSYTYSCIYTVQTSPLRLWTWVHDVYLSSKTRLGSLPMSHVPAEVVESTTTGVAEQWNRFYSIVRDSIRERSWANIQQKFLSPVAFSQLEARRKQVHLRRLRDITASGLGVLMDEGLNFGHDDDKVEANDFHDVKGVVERSVALMDVVLVEVCATDVSIDDFEDKVFAGVEDDGELSNRVEDRPLVDRPAVLAGRLLRILDKTLPDHEKAMSLLVESSGRPSALVRYWLPALLGLVSSTALVRILVNRRADILNWISDLGATVRDFWYNWVVEPIRKVIKTIRHDETSDIAIMSRDSLKADRESLERMVVDFAIDRPQFVGAKAPLSDAQISEIRDKVSRGDVTPVLRAFEQDLRSPFVGAVGGDLIRSLLIQVQKTKVDLEVAMTGIDSLLRSQELVFGFVGLTPGVLVSFGLFQYLHGVFGGRTWHRRDKLAGRAMRILRNVDRILSEARPTENNVLSYKDHGLLLCELHVLRDLAGNMMPQDVQMEFLEDLDDLANVKGIQIQNRALERIRWAYSRWLR